MQIHLVAVGNRMPGWVTEGFEDYRKRLPRECELVLREIAPGKRGKNADLVRIREDEGERVLSVLEPDDRVKTRIPRNLCIIWNRLQYSF